MYRGRNNIDREALLGGQLDCVISSTVNRAYWKGKFYREGGKREELRKTDMILRLI